MWACNVCTLNQSDKRTICKACGTVRPDLKAQVDVGRAKFVRALAGTKRDREMTKSKPQITMEDGVDCPACLGKHRPHTCGKSRDNRKGVLGMPTAAPKSLSSSTGSPMRTAGPKKLQGHGVTATSPRKVRTMADVKAARSSMHVETDVVIAGNDTQSSSETQRSNGTVPIDTRARSGVPKSSVPKEAIDLSQWGAPAQWSDSEEDVSPEVLSQDEAPLSSSSADPMVQDTTLSGMPTADADLYPPEAPHAASNDRDSVQAGDSEAGDGASTTPEGGDEMRHSCSGTADDQPSVSAPSARADDASAHSGLTAVRSEATARAAQLWRDDLEVSSWDKMRAAVFKVAPTITSTSHRSTATSKPAVVGVTKPAGPPQDASTAADAAPPAVSDVSGAGADLNARRQGAEAPAPEGRPDRIRRPARRIGIDDGPESAAERMEMLHALRNSQLIDSMVMDTPLEAAPTYYPTIEQFANPVAYISSVRREAQQYGGCKIVPPPGWRHGDFSLPADLSFEPRLMPLHKLQQACGFQMAPATTLNVFKEQADELKAAFCEQHGIALPTDRTGFEMTVNDGTLRVGGNVHVNGESQSEVLHGVDGEPTLKRRRYEGGVLARSLEEAEAMRERYASRANASYHEKRKSRSAAAEVSEAQKIAEGDLERCFWRMVRTQCEEMIVPYGADLDAATHASGFKEHEAGSWNLNRLATASGSLLDHSIDVPGVSSPWLYVGGLFAAFCWHTEDLWMYSCNHLHAGATKTWYVVPASAAMKFEKATRSLLPSLFKDSPDLLYQLVAMVAPADLAAQGVPVYQLQQRAGEFIVTFPRAYHAGFSHGFNIAEAVNFACPDWLPFGRNAMACYSRHRRTPVFSMERLLIRLALQDYPPVSLSLADWLLPELRAVVEEEARARETLPTGCNYLLNIGYSPLATARRLQLACREPQTQKREHPNQANVMAYDFSIPQELPPWYKGDDPYGDPSPWNTEPSSLNTAARAEMALLGSVTRAFQSFEEDLLTCVECNRVLFFSGVTSLTRSTRAAADDAHPVPLCACLDHVDSLKRLCASQTLANSHGAVLPSVPSVDTYHTPAVTDSTAGSDSTGAALSRASSPSAARPNETSPATVPEADSTKQSAMQSTKEGDLPAADAPTALSEERACRGELLPSTNDKTTYSTATDPAKASHLERPPRAARSFANGGFVSWTRFPTEVLLGITEQVAERLSHI